jgi:hypothetical protein
MSLISPYSQRIIYLKSLLNCPHIKGSHNSLIEIRSDLGFNMKKLKESSVNDNKNLFYIKNIYNIMELNYPLSQFTDEYYIYLKLISNRTFTIAQSKSNLLFINRLSSVPTLEEEHWNMWGSIKQFISGKCVIDSINVYYSYNLHPIWGCLLNPTGGIIGSGNHDLVCKDWNSYLSMHACVHDASGYLYNYHKIGDTIGYNYLQKSWIPCWSPLSCQYSGIKFWKECYNKNTIFNKFISIIKFPFNYFFPS